MVIYLLLGNWRLLLFGTIIEQWLTNSWCNSAISYNRGEGICGRILRDLHQDTFERFLQDKSGGI